VGSSHASSQAMPCSGAFAMGREWMPCNNFDNYAKALKTKP
jgi:hypothetical protein